MDWFALHPAWFLVWYLGYFLGVFLFTPKLAEKFDDTNLVVTFATSAVLSAIWPITIPIWGIKKVYRKYRPSE